MDEILTPNEVADYLKISKSKVYMLLRRNKIPHIKLDRNVRVRRTDLDDWIKKHLRANP